MIRHDLAPFLTSFFIRYLPMERCASPHTIAAYRDSLKLLLRFAATAARRPVAQIKVEDLTPDLILEFLSHLETTRRNSVRTRNARLAAVHSFFHYILDSEPALASACQRVLAIPVKKATRPVLGYLSERELAHLLAQVDRSNEKGERDYLLLALLYDTGGRIQELLDLTPSDFRLAPPAFVRILGKGRRERLCPLLPQMARLVHRFLADRGRVADDQKPLLQNRYAQRLTRHGARYLLTKYLERACASMPALRRDNISLHTLRHTKAMHLLQAGVPLVTIKDILGHADVRSTEIYVQCDLDMKRNALNLTNSPTKNHPKRTRVPKDLLAWLESL
ncbi:MAG: tyrosine-type recombinase/integrase [Nitrospirae bacterium]|nr:tyrosine-type recombinase/integrase [Nitrospirota bacterium]